MPSDETHNKEITKTGLMPRIELEPQLHRESPTPPLPEISDDTDGQKTGVMPIVLDTTEESKTRDEDSPKGK